MTCSSAIRTSVMRASLYVGLLAIVLGGHSSAQVLSHQKISDTQGGFAGTLDDVDTFGNGAAPLGDLDGDGVTDLAIGARFDDDGGLNRGALSDIKAAGRQNHTAGLRRLFS